MTDAVERYAAKVPEVTLVFWIIKIAATTLGRDRRRHRDDDAELGLSRRHGAVSLRLLVVLVISQIAARRHFIRFCIGRRSWPRPRPAPPWPILPIAPWASAMRADRRSCSSACMATLGVWYWSLGSISVDYGQHAEGGSVLLGGYYASRKRWERRSATGRRTMPASAMTAERWCSPPDLAVLAALYFWTNVSRVFLFWAAFILTRPLGATVGDFLDKPVSDGGLALRGPIASAVIRRFSLSGCLLVLPQRAGRHPGRSETAH